MKSLDETVAIDLMGTEQASIRTVIFAKAPQPGKVKTRLMPALGAHGACAVAKALLHNMVEQALLADIGPVEICASPKQDHPVWQAYDFPEAVQWSDQGEGDLGTRLHRAVARCVAADEMVLLIGADCPSLTAIRLQEAAAALRKQATVMVPALDGGYVLLGLRASAPSLFTQIAWSTAEVAEVTRQRFKQLGLTCCELTPLRDIDEPSDLAYLPKALAQAAGIAVSSVE